MSSFSCLAISLAIVGIGGVALYVGLRDGGGNMPAKIGGSFLTAIGSLGLIACLLTG